MRSLEIALRFISLPFSVHQPVSKNRAVYIPCTYITVGTLFEHGEFGLGSGTLHQLENSPARGCSVGDRKCLLGRTEISFSRRRITPGLTDTAFVPTVRVKGSGHLN